MNGAACALDVGRGREAKPDIEGEGVTCTEKAGGGLTGIVQNRLDYAGQ